MICPLCNKDLKRMTIQHLKTHNIFSFTEFWEKYPQFKNFNNKTTIDNPELTIKQNPTVELLFDNDLKESFDDLQEIEVLKDETPDKPPSQFLQLDSNPDKSLILGFIREKYPNIINNYSIKSKDGKLYITDVAVPSKRLVFDFPNAIWHNQDMYDICHKELKDKILKDEGWKIISVKSRIPKINDLISLI